MSDKVGAGCGARVLQQMSEPGGRSSRSHRSGCPVTGCALPFIQPSSIALSLATEPETDMTLWEAGDTSADSAVVSQYR